jgi:hypothetical protein
MVTGRSQLRLALMALALVRAADAFAQEECLVNVKGATGIVAEGASLCAEAQNRTCVFSLQVCVNEADGGCVAGPIKKKVKAKGRCAGAARLRVKPDATNPVCGSTAGVKVKTKKKGRREGKCTLKIATRTKEKPARKDVDKLTLVCKPNPGDCPPPSTTTTLPGCTLTPCDCCVLPIGELAGCVSR